MDELKWSHRLDKARNKARQLCGKTSVLLSFLKHAFLAGTIHTYLWLNFLLRYTILPAFIECSSIVLIITNEMTAQAIMLNSVAMVFMGYLDDIIPLLFLPNQVITWYTSKAEELAEQADERSLRQWVSDQVKRQQKK